MKDIFAQIEYGTEEVGKLDKGFIMKMTSSPSFLAL